MDETEQNTRVAKRSALWMMAALAALSLGLAVPFQGRQRLLQALALPALPALQPRVLLGAAIVLVGALVWAIVRHRERPMPGSAERGLMVLALLGAGVSGATATLGQAQSYNVGDNSHYFLGAKYARELGYNRHYECVGTALAERGITPPRRYRNLRNNKVRPLDVSPGGRSAERCRARFSAPRWQSFVRDVGAFRGWQEARDVERRFLDHGYNGTPFWSVVLGAITNAWPLSAGFQAALGLANFALLSGALGLTVLAFGWELGLCYAALFWINYTDRYLLGGAALRYLPISAVVIGCALCKLGRPRLAGVCVGLAAALVVFPGLLLAAAGAYAGLQLIAARGRWRALSSEGRAAFELTVSGAATVLACALASALYHGGFEVFQAFLDKMALNSGRLSSGRIGFVFNFLWPKVVTEEPVGYDVELATLHARHALGLSLDHLRWTAGALLLVALARGYRAASLLSFMVIGGFALFFVGFPTVRYYYTGWVALPLALHAAPSSTPARAVLASLALASALGFVLEPETSHAFVHNTMLTMAITLVLGFLALPAVAARFKAPAALAEPGSVSSYPPVPARPAIS